MQALGARGINELHIEAGHKLNGSLLKERCVDEVLLYVAPCLLGDRAHGIADLPELNDLAKRVWLKFDDVRPIGSDIRVLARIEPR
jgi:diaminohydroxyphosphoribosylaminopyrimidine deaminase/5-amino-6-(5-phosphoribosylamino)uracil reductase